MTLRGLLVLAALASCWATAASAQAPTGAACEVHVWGAVPTYRPGTFAGPGARVGTPDADRSNPVANINVFDPLVRLRGVSDAQLAALVGGTDAVRVVRHEPAIDVNRAKRARTRLADSIATCYADFVLLELYDVGSPPNPEEYRGLLVEALMARAGLHGTYLVNRFGTGPRPLYRTHDSMITPLAIERPHWSDNHAESVAALNTSVALGVARLARRLQESVR